MSLNLGFNQTSGLDAAEEILRDYRVRDHMAFIDEMSDKKRSFLRRLMARIF
jgi:hypothetical protein